MNKEEYLEYLRTSHWQRERRSALRRAEYSCQVCNADDAEALQVHHRTYARLGCEKPSDLFVLCENCHERIRRNGKLSRPNGDEEDEIEDEEWEEEWEDEDTVMQTFEQEKDMRGRFQIAANLTMNHPRLTLGGGSLLLSFVVDIAIRFDPLVVVLGLGASLAIGYKAEDLLSGTMKLLVPGSNQEQVREDAEYFADQVLADYPIYADQSVGAKLKRLFRSDLGKRLEENKIVDALPEIGGSPSKKQSIKSLNGNNVFTEGEGLTFERIATWLEHQIINDVQFFELLDRIDNPSKPVTRNARNDGAKPPPEADVSGQNKAVTPVTMPLGWESEDLLVLPRLYRIENNIDKCLTGIGVSTSQDNRRFAREILREQGLLKEK